jgi:hypothetical protein
MLGEAIRAADFADGFPAQVRGRRLNDRSPLGCGRPDCEDKVASRFTNASYMVAVREQ